MHFFLVVSILRKLTMHVKTVTAEGTIIGDSTSSIETDSNTSFLQLLGFKIQFHQKDKEKEREVERESRDTTT